MQLLLELLTCCPSSFTICYLPFPTFHCLAVQNGRMQRERSDTFALEQQQQCKPEKGGGPAHMLGTEKRARLLKATKQNSVGDR